MAYNFENYDGKLLVSNLCKYDSNIGYEADFSYDGDVSGWDFFDGIHTYGCWNNYLFGTLYGASAVIGRTNVINPVPAENFRFVRIVMKLHFIERTNSQATPTYARIMWRTLANPTWGSDKQQDFEIYSDNGWHTYSIDLSSAQWWQGDISDLRIYPILEDGRDGDEFFIRAIEITSADTYRCINVDCDYYNSYEHNCPGIGEQGYCLSAPLSGYVSGGTTFEFAETKKYDIVKDVNDTLYVNINEYGFENIILPAGENYSGAAVANILSKEIARLDVGGYAEVVVEYTNQGQFKIYSGTYADDSTVRVGDSPLARDFNFRDSSGADISTKYVGRNPATGFIPYSSFKIKTNQLYSLLDDSEATSFNFNPFMYNIEGGRRDWLDSGLGTPSKDVRTGEAEDSGVVNRVYEVLDNEGKTIIDFTHPFNASGRITKVYAALTLDKFTDGSVDDRGANDETRIENQLSGAKIMFFRPLKDGTLRVLPTTIDIPDREQASGKLYSAVQEYIDIDCDVFVNKGDLIGVYNANVYVGRTVAGNTVDALYYQVSGEAEDILNLRQPYGDGSAGLLFYARSSQIQNRLAMQIDLGLRVNVEDVELVGYPLESQLYFNVARCLDIDWEVDLFGGNHGTGWIRSFRPLRKAYHNHPNLYYGKECLNDGIKVVPDGLAADSFSVEQPDQNYLSYSQCFETDGTAKMDGGDGVIPVGPKYFHCNGDLEWLAVYLHADRSAPFAIGDFSSDPIAFTLKFPFEKEKNLARSRIYFKDQYNFRSFALSVYRGPQYVNGNADDPRFELIPYRQDGTDTPWTSVTLDGLKYTPEDSNLWRFVDLYLADNPCIGHQVREQVGATEISNELFLGTDVSYYDDLAGLQFTTNYEITNNEQYTQALAADWTTITHDWSPIMGKGFRLYCDNHFSTKICEFEVYCTADNIGSAMAGSVEVSYSSYGDYIFYSENTETSRGVDCFVGDTPRYVNVLIQPISEVIISDITLNVSYDDVFAGEKGCEYVVVPEEARRYTETNKSKLVEFKNVYDRPYDLYVDISNSELSDQGTIFYSIMDNEASIVNPEIGADAYYRKHEDYELVNYQSNVAINCPVYALRNLTNNAPAWYTYDNGYSWNYYGEIQPGEYINFSNLPDASITTINLPVLTRSKWWKIGFYDPRIVMTIREIQIYYQDEEIFNINFYHHKNQDVNYGSQTDTAPHLKNNVVDGSYYIIKGDHHIGFELPEVMSFDKIVIYHDFLEEYENSYDKAGIDSSTALCIHGNGEQGFTSTLKDVSYYEHPITVVGNGIACYSDTPQVAAYDFEKDFSYCEDNTETFDGPDIDTDVWKDIVNSHIEDGELHVTNSGIIGSVTTVDNFTSDFRVTVEFAVDGAFDNLGWGAFIEAIATNNHRVGITRTYYQGEQVYIAYYVDNTGFNYVDGSRSVTTDIADMKFKIHRINDVTYVSFWSIAGADWVIIASDNTTIVSDTIGIKMGSDLSPYAQEITTVRFDNFNANFADADWLVDNDFDSYFTCVSGIGPNGYAYWYDTICRNDSDASGYKQPIIFDTQSYPLDEQFEFTFDFSFQAATFEDHNGASSNELGVSVGVLGRHVRLSGHSWYPWTEYFTGAQVVLKRDEIGIAVHNDVLDVADTYVSLATTASGCFCRFTCDGQGTYHCSVWHDDWDGSNLVADFELQTDINWQAFRIGVGSGFGSTYLYDYRATGWVSDFDFDCTKNLSPAVIHDSSLKFSGYDSEKLVVGYEGGSSSTISKQGFYFGTKRVTLDFFIQFNSLPTRDGDTIVIAKCWDDTQPFTEGLPIVTDSAWAFIIEYTDYSYVWKVCLNIDGFCEVIMDYVFTPDLYRWYHFYICRKPQSVADDSSIWMLLRNGQYIKYFNEKQPNINEIPEATQDVVIGENLDGFIEEFRLSSDYTYGGSRVYRHDGNYEDLIKSPPVSQYEKYYMMSFYESVDNNYYGKVMDVDIMYESSYGYREPYSYWSQTYYTYFAVDFGQRYNLELIRSYPIDTSYQFDLNSNIFYSNKETSDPALAFALTEDELILNDDFDGYMNHDFPSTWSLEVTSDRAASYTMDGYLYQSCRPDGGYESSIASPKFYIDGEFDIQIDYILPTGHIENDSWEVSLQVTDVSSDEIAIKLCRVYVDGANKEYILVKDDASSWSIVTSYFNGVNSHTFRIVRSNNVFSFYTKAIGAPDSSFVKISYYQFRNDLNPVVKLSLNTISDSTAYPTVEVFWDNFRVNSGTPIYSNFTDTRWMRVKLLNGDGEDRLIERFDVFPRVSVQTNAIGQYNTYWDSLGSAITSYANAENIALGATASGSGSVGYMLPENTIDGIITDGSLEGCWAADGDDDEHWLSVHFSEVKSIFRFKLYHGFLTDDLNNIITDYRIQVSTDGESFTTVFTVTDNEDFTRTHDLATPVDAKVVRLYVDGYNAINRFVWHSEEEGYQFWNGPILRELEIYEYYGFTVVNSEDTPIIAVNLQQQFFIKGHDMVGVDTEDTEIDWDNDSSNFAWASSRLDDPSKISFSDWGTEPYLESWVVVKRNTATHYPTVPTPQSPNTDMPDYLKHLVVRGYTAYNNKPPRPVEYPWFWRSEVSELSFDYDNKASSTVNRSLKIEYPATTTPEHVRFIEGDHFGWDSVTSWRDGFGFFVYIDDVSKLDLEYGYFYLGGYDYTDAAEPVVYRWNTTTFSGSLSNGWNNLNLTFLYADDIIYTELDDAESSGRDPRRLYTINWATMGFVFRGKGEPININFEGFYIERNHFEHTCFPGQRGLCLNANDVMKASIGELNMRSGAIEFFIRPDWGWDARDIYDDFKYRTLFHFGNVANDILGAAVSSRGVEIYYGNMLSDFGMFIISDFGIDILDELVHMAFVFSNDGTGIADDGSTLRLYINNRLVAKHTDVWQVSDNKYFNFVLGGQGLINQKSQGFDPSSSAISGVVCRLKIHNYCKVDYSDSMPDFDGDIVKTLIKPNNFIEISKDNVTFHKVGSADLPLFFEDVPNGDTIPVWVRVNVPRGITGLEKRTAEIIGSWDIGV